MSRLREGLSPGAAPPCPQPSATHSPIRQDALSDLTDEDEEQHEGEDPAQVVPREVQPGTVVNVHLGALAAPSCRKRHGRQDAHLEEAHHGGRGSMRRSSRPEINVQAQSLGQQPGPKQAPH